MKYFLDSNTCIWLLSGKQQNVINRYKATPFDDMALPSVVAAELLYGAFKSNKREESLIKIRQFIYQFSIIGLDASSAEAYGEIRADLERIGKPIGPNDYFIAAIAKAHNAILVTNNTREFKRVSGLSIEDWTQ